MNLASTPADADPLAASSLDFAAKMRKAIDQSLAARPLFWGVTFLTAISLDVYLFLNGHSALWIHVSFQVAVYASTLMIPGLIVSSEAVTRFSCECLADASVAAPMFLAVAHGFNGSRLAPNDWLCGAFAAASTAALWFALNGLRSHSQRYKVLFANAFCPSSSVPSERQRYETCVHEAAHALLFALLPIKQRTITVSVPMVNFGSSQGGLYWNKPPEALWHRPDFLLWNIAMSAAGGLAERMLLHVEPRGCEADMDCVRRCVAALPKDYDEVARDRAVAKAYALATGMILANSEWIHRLAETLFVRQRLAASAIQGYLNAACLTTEAGALFASDVSFARSIRGQTGMVA